MSTRPRSASRWRPPAAGPAGARAAPAAASSTPRATAITAFSPRPALIARTHMPGVRTTSLSKIERCLLHAVAVWRQSPPIGSVSDHPSRVATGA